MLKVNCYLDTDEVVVGKRVYIRNRPDMIGIITDVKKEHPYPNTPTFTRSDVKIYYCRSKRTSKWTATNYKVCDFDKYIQEINENYSHAALLIQAIEQAESEWRDKNGNKTGQVQSEVVAEPIQLENQNT